MTVRWRSVVKNRRGVSVLEVLLALSMAGVILASVGSLLGSVRRIDAQSGKQERALALARQSLEVASDVADQYFGCICASAGGPDLCDNLPSARTCHRASDGQTCTYRENFSSCWTEQPNGLPGTTVHTAYDPVVGAWTLADGPEDLTAVDPQFVSRTVLFEPQGGDPNVKKLTSTVAWNDRGATRTVQLSTLLSSWKDL